ncbi:MAG: ZPR1 zinc finger domain-containing protein [Candidatus Woesearchaeota archaeon]
MIDPKTNLKYSEPVVLENQRCPLCLKDTLRLTEISTDVPFFGKTYIFSAECQNPDCNFKISDTEFDEQKDPVKITFKIEDEKDLNALVVKSSNATVMIDNIIKIESGGDGYITTIEGLLMRAKEMLENLKESSEDDVEKNELWENIKKINRILWNENKGRIIIEDPSGNSAIISEKAKIEKLKMK